MKKYKKNLPVPFFLYKYKPIYRYIFIVLLFNVLH